MKRRVRQYPFPLCQEHILRDYASAVNEVSTDRFIQRSFWHAHRRNEKGDIDNSLIPIDIQEWYIDSSDEDETVSERESDLETEEPSDVSDHDSELETNWIHVDKWYNIQFFQKNSSSEVLVKWSQIIEF